MKLVYPFGCHALCLKMEHPRLDSQQPSFPLCDMYLYVRLSCKGSLAVDMSTQRLHQYRTPHLHAHVVQAGLAWKCVHQDAVGWLVQKDMVQALLRAHLHQRQYVDQVQKVLKTLATEDGLQADHLELLWNLTEKARMHATICFFSLKC